MPDEQIPVATPEAVVPDPNSPSAQPAIHPDRTAIIQKYEQQYFTPEATPSAAEVTPVAPEPAAPEVPAVDPRDQFMQQVMVELQELKSRVAPPPAPEPSVPVSQEDWLKLLSEGKKIEGERALAELLGPQIQEQAVQKALALMQAERAVTDYNNEIRTKNADLLDMEEYIGLGANMRIQAAQQAGRIKTPADYVTVYKEAVNAEIENARKLTQKLQGAGAQRAAVRSSEVVASQTLRPNPVNTQREQPSTPAEPPVETFNDYFAKRKAQHASFSGLTPVQR